MALNPSERSRGKMRTETRGATDYSLEWVALDNQAFLVRINNKEIENGVYIGAVEGKDYKTEALSVVVNGSPVWAQFYNVYFNIPFMKDIEPISEMES